MATAASAAAGVRAVDLAQDRGPRRMQGGSDRHRPVSDAMLARGGTPMKRRKYSVLAVDGGGIRGVIPARILAAIEHQLEDRPIAHLFDMVAGTSTGGIIALGLTKPSDDPAQHEDPAYSAAEIADLYVQHGRE